MRTCRSFFTVWASLRLPTCNEDDCGLFSVPVLWTGRGQRAQSVDSDHSSSELFVKVSAQNTSYPERWTVLATRKFRYVKTNLHGATAKLHRNLLRKSQFTRSIFTTLQIEFIQQMWEFFCSWRLPDVKWKMHSSSGGNDEATANLVKTELLDLLASAVPIDTAAGKCNTAPTPPQKNPLPLCRPLKSLSASRDAAGFEAHSVSLHTSH